MIGSPFESMYRPALETLQLHRLQKIVRRVYEKVPFYKEQFNSIGIKPEDIKSLSDLRRLPFTVKQDLRDNYPFGLFAVPMDEISRIHSSSGTTGKPTVVGYTKNDLKLWQDVLARVMAIPEIGKQDIAHNTYGYGLFTGGLGVHYGMEQTGATIVPSGGGFTTRQLMLMKDYGATILCATPTFTLHMAEVAKKEGIDPKKDLNIRAIITGAEPASKEMKDQMKELWGANVYEIYGMSEIIGPGTSVNCDHSEKLHIFEDHFLPEIIDPDTGEVLPYGQQGEIVLTTLTKEALPIIRYRTKDISTLYEEPCECGRTIIRMDSPLGRTDDMLIVNGVNVFPSQIEHVISTIKGLTLNYLIIADKKGHLDAIEVIVETEKEVEKGSETITLLEDQLRARIGEHLFIRATITLQSPETLERSVGKAVRVIDKRP